MLEAHFGILFDPPLVIARYLHGPLSIPTLQPSPMGALVRGHLLEIPVYQSGCVQSLGGDQKPDSAATLVCSDRSRVGLAARFVCIVFSNVDTGQ